MTKKPWASAGTFRTDVNLQPVTLYGQDVVDWMKEHASDEDYQQLLVGIKNRTILLENLGIKVFPETDLETAVNQSKDEIGNRDILLMPSMKKSLH